MLPTDDSAEPDTELIDALEPAMLTVPGAIGMLIGSPHARRGSFWHDYQRHFGVDGDPVLVWQSDTKTMNPSASDSLHRAEVCRGRGRGADASIGAQFRSDLEAFISREVLDGDDARPARIAAERGRACGVRGSERRRGRFDDAGDCAQRGGKIVLDAVREVRAPFDPDEVTRQFAFELRRYRRARGGRGPLRGRVAGVAVPGVRYSVRQAERDKSEIYRLCIPLLMSGTVELLDLPVLARQMLALERRTTRTGKELIDHPRGQRDDVVNAVCGAMVEASEREARAAARKTVAVILPTSDGAWRRPFFEGRPRRQPVVVARSDPRESREMIATRRLAHAAIATRQRARAEAEAADALVFEAERGRVLGALLKGVKA